jgi:tetratricopeptide (TPR) repeat protein
MDDVPLERLDDLWDFGDPAESERRFTALLVRARRDESGRHVAETLTQIARAQGLQRRFEDADRTLDDADAALGSDDHRGRVRILLERGRIANTAGRPGRGADSFLHAWEVARASEEDALAVDAAHMLGIVEPPDSAGEWNERAMQLARSSSDPDARRWVASLANNMAWARHDAGDDEKALELFKLALAERERQDDPVRTRIARWSVARCLRSLGRADEALAEQRLLAAELEAVGEIDGYVTEEIAECLLTLGRNDEARPVFARAYAELSTDDELREREPERLERLRMLGEA